MRRSLLFALAVLPFGACECDEVLIAPTPRLVVEPEIVDLTGAPVSQDTRIIFELSNPSSVPTSVVSMFLREPGTDAKTAEEATFDPAFRLNTNAPLDVPASLSVKVELVVRPRLPATIETELVINAEPGTFPEQVIVPISIQAIDLGQPDITVDPTRLDFGRIGQNSVARASVTVRNDGIRDLLMADTVVVHLEEGDNSFSVAGALGGEQPIQPGDEVTVEVIFRPLDTLPHKATLTFLSNDPDEPEVQVALVGLGSQCPIAVAELLDGPDGLEPLDTVRIDGHNSFAESVGTDIAEYEWTLDLRPQGSTTTLETANQERTQLTCDIAGSYRVRLDVIDTDGVRSCNDTVIEFTCLPTEDLHLQLVWDHPTADLDLHLIREGGNAFNHDGDCYFSNRQPEWFADEEANPTLDQDDNRGYGPENINIITPAPNSRWTVLIHYWNKQTDGDQFVTATLRIYARGQLVSSLTQSFESEQHMWTASEIIWPESEDVMPTINLVNTLAPFPRPF